MASFAAFAQLPTIGFKGGVNFATLNASASGTNLSITSGTLTTFNVGAFVDFKYFRFNLYRTKCISSSGGSSGSRQVFKNNTNTSFYRLSENGTLINEEIYKAEYVSADYQATSASFHLKYPVKEVFFPFAGIGPLRLLKESRMNHMGKLAFRWIYWNVLLKGTHIPFVSATMQETGKHFD